MIKKRADELVTALRSGKYKQARGRLRDNDAFCCLGVACDISGLREWSNDHYGGETGFLPLVVQDYFGFQSNNGAFSDDNALSRMNDNGASFNVIADFIEQNWKRL